MTLKSLNTKLERVNLTIIIEHYSIRVDMCLKIMGQSEGANKDIEIVIFYSSSNELKERLNKN